MTKAAQLAGVAALVVIVGGGAFFATKGTSDPAVGSGDVASLLARVEAGTEADLDGDWSLAPMHRTSSGIASRNSSPVRASPLRSAEARP